MAKLLISLVMLLLLAINQGQTFSDRNTSSDYTRISDKSSSVFQRGKLSVHKPFSPDVYKYSIRWYLQIVSPKEPGNYPVLLFIHGFRMYYKDYSQLFLHIASHGFIVVAPQIPRTWDSDQEPDIEKAAWVANWMPLHLQKVLQDYVPGVKGNLDKVAISGHSRGGKTAFALALGIYKTSLKFSALIGVDPVAGRSKQQRTHPHVLTYEPNSLDLKIPVTVIGTGLGNHTIACAPNYVSHEEFYNECKESSHFVITKYGHMQMLDDNLWAKDPFAYLTSLLMCAHSSSPQDATMRTTLGGIMVAFLDYVYGIDDGRQYQGLLDKRIKAPTHVSVDMKKGDNLGFATA